MDPCLLELMQYHFPDVGLEALNADPYQSYTQMYCHLSQNLKFFRGFVWPSPCLKAKIYRAMHLAYGKQSLADKDFIIFSSDAGLIIKHKQPPDTEFSEIFEQYVSQDDSCVFVPDWGKNYKLDLHEFPYYRKLLLDFAKNLTEISAQVLTFSANNPDFLFLSCRQPHSVNIKQKWQEYLDGGILRRLSLELSEAPSALKAFPWSQRYLFELNEGQLSLLVRCTSLEEWEEKQTKIQLEEAAFSIIELPILLKSPQEAFGLLYKLQQGGIDISQVIPLTGTNALFIPTEQQDVIQAVLKEEPVQEDLEGLEIFTQISFSEMNSYQLAGLIKAPSGNYYSYLDLMQYQPQLDPLTRAPYSVEFQEELRQILNQLNGLFLEGFPPMPFDPRLITREKDAFINLYLQTDTKEYLFWKIPDLRHTDYASVTLQAVQVLVIKWTNKSIFKGFLPEQQMDIYLSFHPLAYFVFKETISQGKHVLWPEEEEAQSRKLQEQIHVLMSVH